MVRPSSISPSGLSPAHPRPLSAHGENALHTPQLPSLSVPRATETWSNPLPTRWAKRNLQNTGPHRKGKRRSQKGASAPGARCASSRRRCAPLPAPDEFETALSQPPPPGPSPDRHPSAAVAARSTRTWCTPSIVLPRRRGQAGPAAARAGPDREPTDSTAMHTPNERGRGPKERGQLAAAEAPPPAAASSSRRPST